jgi:dinuclear metal center YbgI/SA1388 family protein
VPTPTLADVTAALDALWPPEFAESWDAVGLVCGDPAAEVSRVLFAVDPVQEVVDEAVRIGADLLVTHHPLYLRGTTTVAPVGPAGFKGQVVHDLIRGGVALLVAHTNADRADPGVSDALAAAVDLRVTGPLVPDPADPTGRRGLGRLCEPLAPLTLAAFAEQAARGLPATAGGLRIAGDPAAVVRTVAVCGGSGDGLFAEVRAAGADVFLTADLRHHPASEARQAAGQSGAPALVDAAHWATEWPWCEQAAGQLDEISDRHGWALRTHVSRTVTDPWTAHAASASPAAPVSPAAPASAAGSSASASSSSSVSSASSGASATARTSASSHAAHTTTSRSPSSSSGAPR